MNIKKSLTNYLPQLVIGSLPFIGAGILAYGSIYVDTGELSLSKQHEVIEQRTQESQHRKERHSELFNKIFGPNGYADLDKSGGINFDEQVDARRRMGDTDRIFIEGDPNFSYTSKYIKLEDLEKAVQSYEADINSQ